MWKDGGEEVFAFRCAGISLWDRVGVAILHLINRSEVQGAGFLDQAVHQGDTEIGKAQGRRQAPAKSCDPGTTEVKPGSCVQVGRSMVLVGGM